MSGTPGVMRSSNKIELDLRVARRLGLDRSKVADITAEFIEVVREALVEERELFVPRLGTFKVVEAKINRDVVLTRGNFRKSETLGSKKMRVERNLRVFFSKSSQLKDELKENDKWKSTE